MQDSNTIAAISNEAIIREIGRRITDRRKAVGLSQDELAEKAKISKQTISKAENGEREIRIVTAIKLAMALNTSLDYFAFGSSSDIEIARLKDKLSGLDSKQFKYVEDSLRMLHEMIED